MNKRLFRVFGLHGLLTTVIVRYIGQKGGIPVMEILQNRWGFSKPVAIFLFFAPALVAILCIAYSFTGKKE